MFYYFRGNKKGNMQGNDEGLQRSMAGASLDDINIKI